ncbi:hypothetical protein [Corynebacterium pseudopelargi]|uniref:Uncharacterized protein n=1 Tax=Corynebacterium pseudopelargi TaxID=2080757 RepID=A0A3G6ISS3_9CORY|nr:hypothetical protein [Corynebacterium pseudopelargi]AZA08633.1 hypothetical protein CPPEL_02485 [Corynebacterium pseudopelargi]
MPNLQSEAPDTPYRAGVFMAMLVVMMRTGVTLSYQLVTVEQSIIGIRPSNQSETNILNLYAHNRHTGAWQPRSIIVQMREDEPGKNDGLSVLMPVPEKGSPDVDKWEFCQGFIQGIGNYVKKLSQ